MTEDEEFENYKTQHNDIVAKFNDEMAKLEDRFISLLNKINKLSETEGGSPASMSANIENIRKAGAAYVDAVKAAQIRGVSDLRKTIYDLVNSIVEEASNNNQRRTLSENGGNPFLTTVEELINGQLGGDTTAVNAIKQLLSTLKNFDESAHSQNGRLVLSNPQQKNIITSQINTSLYSTADGEITIPEKTDSTGKKIDEPVLFGFQKVFEILKQLCDTGTYSEGIASLSEFFDLQKSFSFMINCLLEEEFKPISFNPMPTKPPTRPIPPISPSDVRHIDPTSTSSGPTMPKKVSFSPSDNDYFGIKNVTFEDDLWKAMRQFLATIHNLIPRGQVEPASFSHNDVIRSEVYKNLMSAINSFGTIKTAVDKEAAQKSITGIRLIFSKLIKNSVYEMCEKGVTRSDIRKLFDAYASPLSRTGDNNGNVPAINAVGQFIEKATQQHIPLSSEAKDYLIGLIQKTNINGDYEIDDAIRGLIEKIRSASSGSTEIGV